MWAIFRLRSNFSGAAIQDMWGGGGRDLVCFNSGYHGYGGHYKWIIISFLYTRVNKHNGDDAPQNYNSTRIRAFRVYK